MTTSQSPIEQIRYQAGEIVLKLKNEGAGARPGKDSVTFSICQDDKIIKITMTWKKIHETSAKDLIEAIVEAMTS